MHDTGTGATDGSLGSDDSERIVYKIPRVAEVLDISERHAWRLVKEDKLPSVTFPGSRVRRVTRRALLDFIAQQERAEELKRAERAEERARRHRKAAS